MEGGMEHRAKTRKEINYPILIHHNPTGFINALIMNVSADGMLVDTGQFSLPKGAVVELAGTGSWLLESKMGLPKAIITHAKNGQAGLMLLSSVRKVAEL
jgi:hypothetical protein